MYDLSIYIHNFPLTKTFLLKWSDLKQSIDY